MTRAGRALVILGIAALAALVPAAPALARGDLLRGFDEEFHRAENPGLRDVWFERTADTGARLVRIGVSWRFVAPTEPTVPSNPADPAYNFELIDEIIADAEAHGLAVMIQLVQAPEWAEGAGAPGGVEPGTWKPDPVAFGAFAEAVARRYSGQFIGPSGPLPAVDHIEIWNEANLSRFLTPQWDGTRPESAIHYRRLLNAAYDGIKAANPAAQVIAGATAPYGDPGHPRLGRMRPLRFLREVLCLKPRGTTQCPEPAKFDVISHHPISLSGGPNVSAIHRDDAATADFKEVVELVRRAERAGTVLPAGERREAWATEFWWLSDPPAGRAGVPLRIHANWVQVSLYKLWKQGADAAIYYQLVDKPQAGSAESASGLYFDDERAKPALRAFRFPFVVEAVGRNRRRAWTIPPVSGELTVEGRGDRGGWRALKSAQVTEGVPQRITFRAGNIDLRAMIAGQASLTSPGA